MNLHEFQTKSLFSRFGIPVPEFVVLESADAAAMAAVDRFGDQPLMLKAQVHSGGRGKAGGVRRIEQRSELPQAVEEMLGQRLVTKQTGAQGLPVDALLVGPVTAIRKEYYLSLLLDRAQRRVRIIASASGGMDIEAVAETTPEKILSETIDPALGVMPYQARKIAFGIGLDGKSSAQFADILAKLYELYIACDASLVEVNPLALTEDNQLVALDAKFSADSNALYRQQELADMRDERQEDAVEARARLADLSYVHLDGDIGCMVNGAGLAMATMDLVKNLGGRPANFLDVGGAANSGRVAEAFRLILADHRVRAVLINIFGGIVHCDVIAQGIIDAVKSESVSVPIVARLRGSNAEQGQSMLAESGLRITPEPDLSLAAGLAIQLAGNA